MKVTVCKHTSTGFKQIGERTIQKRANGTEYIVVNGRKRKFDWISRKKQIVHLVQSQDIVLRRGSKTRGRLKDGRQVKKVGDMWFYEEK